MRAFFLSTIAFVVTFAGSVTAQEETPADQAIQEAITILEARKALADVPGDQEKIARAIAALERHLPGKDAVAPEPLKIGIAQLKKKLQAKASFNAKNNELTLVYDLSRPEQLKDFELSTP
jgi:hypothetical protein